MKKAKSITDETKHLVNQLVTLLYIEDSNGDWDTIITDINNQYITVEELVIHMRKLLAQWTLEGSSIDGSYIPNYNGLWQLLIDIEESL